MPHEGRSWSEIMLLRHQSPEREQRLEVQICQTPCFIIAAAYRVSDLLCLSWEKHWAVLYSQNVTGAFEYFIYLFIYQTVSYDLFRICWCCLLHRKRLTMASTMWSLSPDFSLLFLCLFMYLRGNNGCAPKRENDC